MNTSDQPIACDLSVLSEDERRFQERAVARMRDELQDVQELPDGFALRYPDGRTLIEDLARFITLERLCCPFFTFDLRLTSVGELWLGFRGTPEVKTYMRESFPFPLPDEGSA